MPYLIPYIEGEVGHFDKLNKETMLKSRVSRVQRSGEGEEYEMLSSAFKPAASESPDLALGCGESELEPSQCPVTWWRKSPSVVRRSS